MLHFERIENLSSEFQNIDSVHSILKMLGPFFLKVVLYYAYKIGKILFSISRKTWHWQIKNGACIDHFGISFSLQVYTI